jgi:hypothetical protein
MRLFIPCGDYIVVNDVIFAVLVNKLTMLYKVENVLPTVTSTYTGSAPTHKTDCFANVHY